MSIINTLHDLIIKIHNENLHRELIDNFKVYEQCLKMKL